MNFKKPHHTADPSPPGRGADGSYIISPKGLNIVWGNDPRYWKVTSEKAELIQVSWLEVSGVVKGLKEGKRYKVEFEVNVKADAFGWDGTQVLVMAKPGKSSRYQFKEAKLSSGLGNPVIVPRESHLEVKFPDKFESEADSNLYFGLYEVWSGKWKGGLEIIQARVKCID